MGLCVKYSGHGVVPEKWSSYGASVSSIVVTRALHGGGIARSQCKVARGTCCMITACSVPESRLALCEKGLFVEGCNAIETLYS
jgi:hypothetical protein